MGSTRGRLTRSTTDRQIAGVAGGLAEYFDIDPTIVRVAWVAAVAFGGFGLIAYLIMWVVVPEASGGRPAEARALQIAEERYARGEIDVAELEQIRRDLAR